MQSPWTNNRILNPIKDKIEELEEEKYKEEKSRVRAHNAALEEQAAAIRSEMRRASGSESKQGSTSDQKKCSIEDLKQRLAVIDLNKQELPASPKNWGDDITPQRLQQNLHIHHGAFGLFSAEGRTIINRILDKSDSEGSSGKSIYTAATWGDDLYRSRVGGKDGEAEEIEVRKPALTIAAFIQRDIWKEFSQNQTMRQNGTISRICVVSPPSKVGTRLENETDEPFKKERILPFVETIMRIRQWKPSKSIRIALSPEAAKARREFYNDIEQESGPDGRYEDVRDIAGRICSLTARIASIFSALDTAKAGDLGDALPDITYEQWIRAQALGEYLFAQAIDFQRIHGDVGKKYLPQKVGRFLRKWLSSSGSHVLRSQIRKWVRGLEDKTVEQQTIDVLMRAGWIRKSEQANRKAVVYEINPKIAEIVEDLNA